MHNITKTLLETGYLSATAYATVALARRTAGSYTNSKLAYLVGDPLICQLINTLSPIKSAGTTGLFSLVDFTFHEVLKEGLQQHASVPAFVLARLTCSIIATAAMTTLIGLTPTFTAGIGIILISTVLYTGIQTIATNYQRIRY